MIAQQLLIQLWHAGYHAIHFYCSINATRLHVQKDQAATCKVTQVEATPESAWSIQPLIRLSWQETFHFWLTGSGRRQLAGTLSIKMPPVLDPEKKVERQLKVPCSKTVYTIFVARFLTLKSFNNSRVLYSAKRRSAELVFTWLHCD